MQLGIPLNAKYFRVIHHDPKGVQAEEVEAPAFAPWYKIKYPLDNMERHTKNRRNNKYLSGGVFFHFDNNSTQKTHASDPLFPYSKPQYVSVVERMQKFPN